MSLACLWDKAREPERPAHRLTLPLTSELHAVSPGIRQVGFGIRLQRYLARTEEATILWLIYIRKIHSSGESSLIEEGGKCELIRGVAASSHVSIVRLGKEWIQVFGGSKVSCIWKSLCAGTLGVWLCCILLKEQLIILGVIPSRFTPGRSSKRWCPNLAIYRRGIW